MAVNILVDYKLLCYTLFHTGQHLTGAFSLMASLLKQDSSLLGLKFDEIYILKDFGEPNRKKIFPEYKQQRADNRKKLSPVKQEQLKQFSKIYNKVYNSIRHYGNVVQIEGWEADDLAYSFVVNNPDDQFLLITADQDWTKFLEDGRVSMLHVKKRKIIRERDLLNEYGYTKEMKQIMDIFTGSAKENIPGLTKLGPKTFVRYYEEVGGNFDDLVDRIEEALEKRERGITNQTGMDFRELISFNKELFSFHNIRDFDEYSEFQNCLTNKLPFNSDAICGDYIQEINYPYFPSAQEEAFFGGGYVVL